MSDYDSSFAFDQQLWYFYETNRGKIRSRYNSLTKIFLDYNDKNVNPHAYLRKPQFEALEMYVFIKEFCDNRQLKDIFTDWAQKNGDFSDRSYYSVNKNGEQDLFADVTSKQTKELFSQMEKVLEDYPNYIYALAMGLGKTTLMAASIFYEFLLANKFPKNPHYCHNSIVFAPDKTVLQSLKEIITLDKSLIVPPDYQPILDANLHVHYLDDTATSLNAIGNSDFNIVISNTQKIIIKQKSKEDTAAEKLFKTPSLLSGLYDDEELKQGDNLIINQRFERLCELNQLGVYVDEGHHLFGTDLEKALHDKSKETSLRKTINMLSEKLKSKGSAVVACYNYTGTPYVNNRILPEVVYSCGLSESILNGYLKDADPQGFENVKDIEYLNASIQRFMEAYKGQTFEGLIPKMAIYAATVDEAVNVVKPAVESAIAKYGLGPDKVLVNVGDSKYTKDVDIKYFNNLDVKDTPGSQKQFIILCEKGTEGWNCRSLFAVCLFRDSFSRVFVLQSTMRCLRAITDAQQTAQIFLSKKNWDILNDELHKNFNMDIKDLGNKNKKERKFYQVRVLPPPRYLTVNVLSHRYSLEERKENKPVDFELEKTDFSQYESKIYIKNGMASSSTVKEENADKYKDKIDYSLYTLTAELARYLNLSPMKVMDILDSSVDGADLVLEKTNLYNEIVYDILAPKIFDSLYKVKVERVASPKKLLLLKEPKDSAYYEFSANPDLVVKDSAPEFVPYKAKSFHADTYCFDSNPEKELFNQYIKSKDVQSVYFTGMFTAGQGDLCIQYVDPETHRVRSYYPDFVAKMKDGSYQIIEVKGDNMIDNAVVKAKAAAAEEIATESAMEYKMYAGNFIMKNNVLQKKTAFYDFGATGELLVADGKKIDGFGEADKNRTYNIRH